MTTSLEAAAVSVRLRRLWLGEILGSDELEHSDLADAALDVELRRVGSVLVLRTPYDFGAGDPLAGALGTLLRERVRAVSKGAVDDVGWEFATDMPSVRRARTDDLDVFAPGDPVLDDYPDVLERLRARIPATTTQPAREAVGALRLVGVSRFRLWFAAPSKPVRDAVGTVPGARAALVTAVQGVQGVGKEEKPLYRVVVDAGYRGRRALV